MPGIYSYSHSVSHQGFYKIETSSNQRNSLKRIFASVFMVSLFISKIVPENHIFLVCNL